jgi:hypothetical protein
MEEDFTNEILDNGITASTKLLDNLKFLCWLLIIWCGRESTDRYETDSLILETYTLTNNAT